MTYTTLQPAGGPEMCLADWQISAPIREIANQQHDHFAFDLNAPADSADPFPYGTQIILRIGRVPAGQPGQTAAGLPVSGVTSWTGGQTWFIGWRVENTRTGSAAFEKLAYKFAGPWEYFFERLVFRKCRLSWNGTANVPVYQDRITLGLSLTTLYASGETPPGVASTNLMSIAQQIKEIVNYAITQTGAAYEAGQFTSIFTGNVIVSSLGGTNTSIAGGQLQFDPLAADSDGNYLLNESPGPNCAIPDYLQSYAASGQTSATANLSTVLRAPLDTVTSVTCAEALRKMCRWIGPFGSPVIWFDYTTSPPTLHIATKDQLPSLNLPYPLPGYSGSLTGPTGPMDLAVSKIKRRDDLIPACVALDFSLSGTWDGQQYCYTIRDVAGTISGAVHEGVGLTGQLLTISSAFTGSPAYVGGSAGSSLANELEQLSLGFEAQTTTLDMEGGNSSISYCTIATMALTFADPSGGGSALAFWQHLFPEMAQESSPSFAIGAVPITVTDDAGNVGSIGTDGGGNPTVTFSGDSAYYSYLLTDGQIAPWMLAGNVATGAGAKSRQCTIAATFAATKNNKVTVSSTVYTLPVAMTDNHPKNARCTLVSIAGGIYSRQQPVPGEIVPYGLAGYIYNIETIPQYEGTLTLQETEITDQVPLGNNLCLTGSLAEWSTMNACVQQIRYDQESGRTSLTFGPASHLGAKDFVERLRVNRPPRWYNLQNQNPSNAAAGQKGTQLGNNLPQRGPNNAEESQPYRYYPISFADSASKQGDYGGGLPGISIDNRASGQANYGDIGSGGSASPIAQAVTAGLIPAAPTKPTIHLQGGSAGSYSAQPAIRISLSDVPGGQQLWVQETLACHDFGDGNGSVPCYALVLRSQYYKDSLYGSQSSD